MVKLIQYAIIAILIIIALICLLFVARVFKSRNFPIIYPANIQQSFIIGGLTSCFGLVIILTFGVNLWIQTGMVKSILGAAPLLCIVPFLFIISSVGSFIQIFYVNRMAGFRDSLIMKANQSNKERRDS